jgi:hypothetical protein
MPEEQALARRKKILSRRRKIAIILALYTHLYVLRTPVRTSIRTGEIFTNEILNAHPRRALEVLRMPITTFLDLRDWLAERHLLRSSRGVTIEEQLMIFLCIVGHNSSNRDAQELFLGGEGVYGQHREGIEVALFRVMLHEATDRTTESARPQWRSLSSGQNSGKWYFRKEKTDVFRGLRQHPHPHASVWMVRPGESRSLRSQSSFLRPGWIVEPIPPLLL